MIKELCNIISISGYEYNISQYIYNYLKKTYTDEVFLDNIGNVIFHRYNPSSMKILLIAHIDEVGFQILKKLEDKKYKFKTLGNIKTWNSHHQHVEFSNKAMGIIYSSDEKIISENNNDNMFVEITDDTDIKIGDTFTFENKFIENKDYYISKALDNRIGCYSLLKSLETLTNIEQDFYIAFTTLEEVNMRGARVAITNIKPDFIINVDVSPVGKLNNLILGNGVGIKISDRIAISDSELVTKVEQVANQNNITFQLEVSDTGTSELLIVNENDWGAKSIGLSIPCENIHSSKVKVHKFDVEECIKLLKCILVSF